MPYVPGDPYPPLIYKREPPKIDPAKEFFTKDFYMATAFAVYGFLLLRLEKIDDRTAIFIFEKSDSLNDAIKDWRAHKATINVYDYVLKMKKFRGLLREVMNPPGIPGV